MQRNAPGVLFRRAAIADIKEIHRLINDAASKDELLPRSLSDLYERLRDFHVCEQNGRIVGCCGLHVLWDDLAEIRSLMVDSGARGAGIGEALVKLCIDECRVLGINRIFVLTYIPRYFEKLGFSETSKDKLPHKVWSECVKCPKFPDCGETAMILHKG